MAVSKDKLSNLNLIKELGSDKFINFFYKKLAPALDGAESLRKKTLYKLIALWSIGLPLYLYAFLQGYKFLNKDLLEPLLILSFFVFIVLHCFFYDNYKSKIKSLVYPKLFSFWGDFTYRGKTYSKTKSIRGYIESLDLFDSFNRYYADDFIDGNYNGLDVQIQETELTYVRGSGKNRTETTIFDGIFMMVDCNKKFNGATVIETDSLLGNCFGKSGLERVKLEDPVFEKYFEVYTTDQIEARYLLTTSFMNRLVQISSRFRDGKIICSFEKGQFNIGVKSSKNWFEISIFKKVTKLENFQKILLELASLLSIIDALKLENDIGV